MINYISTNFCISTFPRCGSTSILNWCYYIDNKKEFDGTKFGYGHTKIKGSGIHWFYLYHQEFTIEKLLKQKNEKILVVRDPIDRFISSYEFLRTNTHDNLNIKLKDISIECFIQNLEMYNKNDFVKIHTQPYFTYLKNFDKNFFSHIIMKDNISWLKGYIEKKQNIRIPDTIVHLNKTTTKHTLSKELKSILKDYYHNDYAFLF